MSHHHEPAWLRRLESEVFTGLCSSLGNASEIWARNLFTEISPIMRSKNVLNRIRYRWLHDLLKEQVLPLVPVRDADLRNCIDSLLLLFERRLNGEAISADEWWQYADIVLATDDRAFGLGAAVVAIADAAAYDRDDSSYRRAADVVAGVTRVESNFWEWAAVRLLQIIRDERAAWEAAGKPA
jgi:hypothetical protein